MVVYYHQLWKGIEKMTANQIPEAAPDALALTIPQACRRANIGRSTLYQMAKEGRLKITKCGRKSLIRVEALNAWMDGLDG